MEVYTVEDFSKILPNWCTQKALRLNFNDILDGPIFVSGRSKNLKFSPGRSKSRFQRPEAQFFAKKVHKKGQLCAENFFRPLKHQI